MVKLALKWTSNGYSNGYEFYRAKLPGLKLCVGYGSVHRDQPWKYWFRVGDNQSARKDFPTKEEAMYACERAAARYAQRILEALGPKS